MSRTVSVFEHGTLKVRGAGSSEVPDSGLSQAEFDELVRFNDEGGRRFFDVGFRAITFRQYVGYLQVGDLGIEVLPKADRLPPTTADSLQWRDVLLEMLKVAHGIDLRLSDTARQSLGRPSLIELVVAHLLPRVERLVHEGLARGYRTEESNGQVFRGKLVVAEHLGHNHSRADRCFVRYQVFDRDITVNRLLRAALEVAARAPISTPLRARVRSLISPFQETSPISPSPELFDGLALSRSTERYRDALTLARMLIEGLAPALRRGKTRVFSLLFDMNQLWERYVGVLFQRARVPGVRVRLQNTRTFWLASGDCERTLRADIILVDERSADDGSPRVIAVIDTKWKPAGLRGPGDEDLKQMFAYNEMFETSQAFLLYPATQAPTSELSGTFSIRGHRCTCAELVLQHGEASRKRAMAEQVARLVNLAAAAYAAERLGREAKPNSLAFIGPCASNHPPRGPSPDPNSSPV